jgi:hypothetical protein
MVAWNSNCMKEKTPMSTWLITGCSTEVDAWQKLSASTAFDD